MLAGYSYPCNNNFTPQACMPISAASFLESATVSHICLSSLRYCSGLARHRIESQAANLKLQNPKNHSSSEPAADTIADTIAAALIARREFIKGAPFRRSGSPCVAALCPSQLAFVERDCRVCVCTGVCARKLCSCTCTCVRTHVCARARACVRACVRACTCARVCACVCVCVCMRVLA